MCLLAHLKIRDPQQELSILCTLDVVKDCTDCQRNDAWSSLCAAHGVGLATASLSICKHSAVEAANHFVDDVLGGVAIDLFC